MANPILNLGPVDGQRIGLFGGSFNPPHRGHLAVSMSALRRLKLDWIWWLVSPRNPLKDPSEISDFAERAIVFHGFHYEGHKILGSPGSLCQRGTYTPGSTRTHHPVLVCGVTTDQGSPLAAVPS